MENIYIQSRPGFALTELLIFVAIILVLAAILLPMFTRTPDNRHYLASQNCSRRFGLESTQSAHRKEKILSRSSSKRRHR
jgi:type II secretory pathway pseudopilin PulG